MLLLFCRLNIFVKYCKTGNASKIIQFYMNYLMYFFNKKLKKYHIANITLLINAYLNYLMTNSFF